MSLWPILKDERTFSILSFDSSIVSANEVKEIVAQAEKYINVDNQKARNILDKAIDAINPTGIKTI